MINEQDNLSKLLEDLPRGQAPNKIGQPPFSHFESPANLAATRSLQFEPKKNKASRMFLGVVGGNVVTKQLATGQSQRFVAGGYPLGVADDRHHLLIASSRAGKGIAVLIPILLTLLESSVLCVDPKGTLAQVTARWRSKFQQIAVLDPAKVTGNIATQFDAKFNPLNMLAWQHGQRMVSNARLISDSIIVPGDFKEKHWDQTAIQFLTAIILHVFTFPRYSNCRDLVTVRHLIVEAGTPCPNSPNHSWLETEMMSNSAANNFVANGARQFYERTGGEFSSVLSNLRKHTDWIDFKFIRPSLIGDGIDLRDLKRSSLTVYAVVEALMMSSLSGWLRMLVQLSLAAHEQEREQNGPSTVMMLDEFNILGRIEPLEVAAAQIAGLGAKILAVVQDLSQLRSKYPKSWETFVANAGTVQCFGISDNTTCEYISKRLGVTTTLSRSTNSPTFDQATQQGATGESWSLATHPLLNAEEVSRYFSRDDKQLRQLILRPGFRPAIIQKAYYFKHEMFAGRFDRER